MCNDERVCECETFRDEYRNDDESSGRAGSSVRRRTIFFRKSSSDACSMERGWSVGRKKQANGAGEERGLRVF